MKKTAPIAASALLLFNILTPAMSHAGPPNTSYIRPRHAAAPAPAPAAPSSAEVYEKCDSYIQYESQTYEPTNPKSVATARLGAALYTAEDTNPVIDVQGRATCAILAIQNGADVNHVDPFFGETPLQEALAPDQGPSNAVAAMALIKAGANVNIQVQSVLNPTQHRTLFHVACESFDDDAIQAMLNAGADPVANQSLDWSATTGDDVAVAAILATKKVPVNQLTPGENQTALDSSEQDLYAINNYFTQFPTGQAPTADSISNKQYAIDGITASFSTHYPRSAWVSADPKADLNAQNTLADSFVKMLLGKQQKISAALKAAGWTCNLPNCGNPVPPPPPQYADGLTGTDADPVTP